MTRWGGFDKSPLAYLFAVMLTNQFFGLPLAVLPTALTFSPEGCALVAAAGDRVDAYMPQVQVIGATAILPISGYILKGYGGYYGCDLHYLDRMIDNIANDPMIKNVIVDVNSGGGMTPGVDTTARKITDLALAGKRTYAYTDTMAASAAYWMIAGCQKIVANPTAILGSISTLMVAYDYSKQLEDNGIVAKVFRTGELKGAGVYGKPWTPEEEAAVERRMQFVDQKFKSFIAEKRGLSAQHMNGDFWFAENAPVGLVDALADSIEDLIVSLPQ
jgi:hypothetical protein